METIVTRLRDGQDLLVTIQKLAKVNNIQAGVILSGVGSLKTSNIRLPIIDGETIYINPENLEIDSLQGTVSLNGCHIHITVSNVDSKVFGGHLMTGCIIRTTCELVLGVLEDISFKRVLDSNTGFDELLIE